MEIIEAVKIIENFERNGDLVGVPVDSENLICYLGDIVKERGLEIAGKTIIALQACRGFTQAILVGVYNNVIPNEDKLLEAYQTIESYYEENDSYPAEYKSLRVPSPSAPKPVLDAYNRGEVVDPRFLVPTAYVSV